MPSPLKQLPKWTRTIDPAKLAVAFVGIGFLAIILGWNGAARQACVDCQFPYLLSGGAAGLGFITLGAGLFLFEAWRRGQAHLEHKLDELISVLRESRETPIASPSAAVPGAATAPPPSDRAPSTTPVRVAPQGEVVIGRSSFHRPDCRLVEGKEEIEYAPLSVAQQRGLQPCRVCDPTRVEEPAAAQSGRGRKR